MALTIAQSVLMGLLLLVVGASPFAFGAVHPFFYTAFQVITFALLALSVLYAVLAPARPAPAAVRRVCLLAASFGILTALQLLPIPVVAARLISPNTLAALRSALPWRSEVSTITLSLHPLGTQLSALQYLACFVLFILAAALFDSRPRRLAAAWFLTTIGVVLALVGLYQHWHSPGRIYGFWESVHGGLHFGPFVNRNHFAGYLAMIMPLTAALVFIGKFPTEYGKPTSSPNQPPSRWVQALAVGCFLIMLVAIVVSLSRGGMIALAAAVTVMSAVAWGKAATRQARWFFPAAFTVGFLLGAWYAGPELTGRLRDLYATLKNPMQSTRTIATLQSLKLFGRYPLFGTGLGSFQAVFTSVQTPELGLGLYRYAHNDWAQLAVETGIAGLAITGALAAAILLAAYRRLRRKRTGSAWWLTLGATASLTALAVHSAFEFNLHIPSNAFLASVVVALLMVSARSSPRPSRLRSLFRTSPLLAGGVVLSVAAAMACAASLCVNHYISSALLREIDGARPTDEERLLRANARCPRNPRPFFTLFGLYGRMARDADGETATQYYHQAVRWGRLALELNPTSSLYHERLGRLHFWGNPEPTETDMELAEHHLLRAVEFDPAFPEWSLTLAHFYLDTGRFSKADQCYARVVRLDPARMEEVVAKLTSAGTSIERMRAILPQSVEANITVGDHLLARGNDVEAADSYALACQLAAQGPADRRVEAALGLARTGEIQRARSLLSTWMEQAQQKLPYIRALAETARMENDQEQTLRYLEMAVDTASPGARDLVALADARRSSDDWEAALVLYREAFRLEPRSESLCDKLVECLGQTDHHEEALKVARSFLRRAPRSHRAHFRMGRLLEQQNRLEEAFDYYERAAALAPDNRRYRKRLESVAREREKLRRLRSEAGR